MANLQFVVEDGSAVVNANSYVDVNYFLQYCVNMGYDAASWDDTRVQRNLIKATAYIDARYRTRFKGRKYTKQQALQYPRIDVAIDGTGEDSFVPGIGPSTDGFIVLPNEIPDALKQADCEMAIRCDTNVPAPDIDPGTEAISRKKVGPIEIEWNRKNYLPYKLWRYVDMLMTPLLSGSSISIQIVRT